MRIAVLSLLALLALAGGAGAAPAPAVQDKARLFNPEAVGQAEEHLREVREKYGLGLVVETLPALPEEEANARADRWGLFRGGLRGRKVLAEEALKRAEAAGRDAVYVLICKNPRHVSVVVWPEGRERDYPFWDREKLRKHFARGLAGDPNATLLSAADLFEATLHERMVGTGGGSPFSNYTLVGAALGLVVLWLGLVLLRSRLAARPAAPAEVVGGRAALLGGLFGFPAGWWVSDRLLAGGPQKPLPEALADLAPVETSAVEEVAGSDEPGAGEPGLPWEKQG